VALVLAALVLSGVHVVAMLWSPARSGMRLHVVPGLGDSVEAWVRHHPLAEALGNLTQEHGASVAGVALAVGDDSSHKVPAQPAAGAAAAAKTSIVGAAGAPDADRPRSVEAVPAPASIAPSPAATPSAQPTTLPAGLVAPSPAATPQPRTELSVDGLGHISYSAEDLKDTAMVSMASDDHSARLALALMQSLRDVGTQVPNLVLLLPRGGIGSDDCRDEAWRKARQQELKDDRVCFRRHEMGELVNQTLGEIISERYVAAFRRLGVQLVQIDPIPQTEYTRIIPGGPQTFWGMA